MYYANTAYYNAAWKVSNVRCEALWEYTISQCCLKGFKCSLWCILGIWHTEALPERFQLFTVMHSANMAYCGAAWKISNVCFDALWECVIPRCCLMGITYCGAAWKVSNVRYHAFWEYGILQYCLKGFKCSLWCIIGIHHTAVLPERFEMFAMMQYGNMAHCGFAWKVSRARCNTFSEYGTL